VANYEGSNVEISKCFRVVANSPAIFWAWNGILTWFFFCSVANEQGHFTTPSFVSFTDKERLIGDAAKNQAAMNPANTIFDIK
jgi:Hsp70 protein